MEEDRVGIATFYLDRRRPFILAFSQSGSS